MLRGRLRIWPASALRPRSRNVTSRVNKEESVDRRASGRVSYRTVVGIREYDGSPLDTSGFHSVQARDLSQTGISLRTPCWPRSDRLLVMLSTRQQPSFAIAQIVECRAQSLGPGQREFEVRCEFDQWVGLNDETRADYSTRNQD